MYERFSLSIYFLLWIILKKEKLPFDENPLAVVQFMLNCLNLNPQTIQQVTISVWILLFSSVQFLWFVFSLSFFFSFWKVPCTFWVSTPVMILSELSWYLRLWCRMLIGWKEVALELSYMQHDISHGSFKWLDWQCQLCQAAMYKYKKTLAPYASEMFQAALLWSALSTQEVAFAVENKANKINWYQEISQVTAVELKYARWIMNLNNNVF